MQTYTRPKAVEYLNRLAEEAENENYHTECSLLYEAADIVSRIDERTLVMVPAAYDSLIKFIVTP